MSATLTLCERIFGYDGDKNEHTYKTSYPLVFVAVRRDLEITGSDRGTDRATCRHDPWHCANDRWYHRQPDGDWRYRRRSAGYRGIVVVLKGNILNDKGDPVGRPYTFIVEMFSVANHACEPFP